MDRSEELREALLDLEESRKRERQQRKMSEVLLAGLRAIVMAGDPDEIFHELLDVLREPLDFEAAFVLRENSDGTLTASASSDSPFADTIWQPQAMFERVFAGQPVAVYDTELVDEWRSQPDAIRQKARSALQFAIHASEPRALFVCTHPERAHFSQLHVTLARRFSVLATEALQKIESGSEITNLKRAEEALAKQAAELAETNERLREKDRLLTAFDQIGQAMLSSLDLERMLDLLGEQIVETGIFPSLMIALADEQTHSVEVVRSFTRRGDGSIVSDESGAIGFRYDLDDANITAEVARSGEMQVVVGWDDRYDRRFDEPESHEGRVAYFIPIKQEDRVFGFLATASRIEEQEEMRVRIEAMHPLLDEMAIALTHIKLFEAVQASEKVLRESEEKIRAVFDASPDVIHLLDSNGIILSANEGYVRRLGLEMDDVVGKSVFDFTPHESIPGREAAIDKVFRTGESVQFEDKGTVGVFESHVEPVFNPAGEVTAVAVYARDITERKQGAKALAGERDLLQSLMDNMPDTIYFKDTASRFTRINKAQAQVLGVSDPEDAVGRTDSDFFAEEHAQVAYEEEQEIVKTGKALIAKEEKIPRANGAFRWVSATKVPIKDAEGQLTGIVGLSRDITERKQAESALQMERDKLNAIFESMQDGIYIVSKDREIQYVNPVLKKEFGSPEGKKCHKYFHGSDEPCTFCKNKEVFAGKTVRWEWTSPRGRTYDLIDTPLQNADGSISKLEIFRDITERKQAEEALQESKETAESYLAVAAELIITLDTKGKITLLNESGHGLLGYKIGELVGKNWFDTCLPRNIRKEVRGVFKKLMLGAAENVEIYESPVLARNGEERTILWHNSLLKDDEGRITGLLSSGEDITERKRAEDILRESEDRLKEAQEMGRIGNWEFDIESQETKWSEQVYKLYGRDPALGPPAAEEEAAYYSPEQAEILREYARRAIEEGEEFQYDLQVALPGGKTSHFSSTMRPGKDEGGHTVKLFGTVQDITERKQAEEGREKLQEQLRQAQKMESVGRLAGGVAHDFNNMLGVILGYTEMALEKTAPDESLHAYLEEIRKAAKRSADLTRQLLAFARKQTIAPKVLDLNETVGGMLKMLRRLIGENMDLVWMPGAEVWPVKVDPSQIDQILANLCVNARDAIEGVGKVIIETNAVTFDEAYCADHMDFVPGEYVLLSVSDDGCGMDKETQDRLFEPFFTTKEVGKGTGLGLATIYGIVKQNNGFVNVYSEPGEGTTFKIYLPRYAAKAGRMREEGPAEPAKRGQETILLVEDEPTILEMTTMMLEHHGYTVLAASTPGEAIRLTEAHSGEIHLLMTDVVMPEMNGRDLAKNLLSLYPNLKRLFMSGYTANAIAHHGVLDEGVHFLHKPFAMQVMAAKVREALDSE